MTGEHPLSVEELMEFLDGQLPAAQAPVVQAHVTGCESCRRLGAELRGVSRDLQQWEVEDAPATLAAPTMPSVKARLPLLTWLRNGPALAAVAAVGLLLAVGLNNGTHYMLQPRASREQRQVSLPPTPPPSPFGGRSSGGAGVSEGVASRSPAASMQREATRPPAAPSEYAADVSAQTSTGA